MDQDVRFRHSGWLTTRRRVYDALRTLYPSSTRQVRFAECGSNAWVIKNEESPGAYAVASDHCHDRFCRPCAAFRARVIAHNVANFLADRPYRFLTLTIKTSGLTLCEAVDKLYRSFTLLRRTSFWHERVTGGCAVCEVKPKREGTGWHPHLHCIIEGKFLPVRLLQKHWLAITEDSFVVDIRLGQDSDAAASYVSKYVTKPFTESTTREPNRLVEAIQALHGRRLVSTFGTWRGERLTQYHPSGVWTKVCPLGRLRYHAARGDEQAANLLAYLIDSQPYRDLPANEPRSPPC